MPSEPDQTQEQDEQIGAHHSGVQGSRGRIQFVGRRLAIASSALFPFLASSEVAKKGKKASKDPRSLVYRCIETKRYKEAWARSPIDSEFVNDAGEALLRSHIEKENFAGAIPTERLEYYLTTWLQLGDPSKIALGLELIIGFIATSSGAAKRATIEWRVTNVTADNVVRFNRKFKHEATWWNLGNDEIDLIRATGGKVAACKIPESERRLYASPGVAKFKDARARLADGPKIDYDACGIFKEDDVWEAMALIAPIVAGVHVNERLIYQVSMPFGLRSALREIDFTPFAQSLMNAASLKIRISWRIGGGELHSDLDVPVKTVQARLSVAHDLALKTRRMMEQQSCALVEKCLVTTAACGSMRRSDDCFELRMLRRLRDTWLVFQDFGIPDLEAYSDLGPKIISEISCRQYRFALPVLYVFIVVPAAALESVRLHRFSYWWAKHSIIFLATRLGLS